MNKVTQLPAVAGVEISTDSVGRFNLNALHKASGEGANKAPAQWMRIKQAQELMAEVEKQTMQICTVSIGGRNGGTFSHELLAVEYAGWISPAFRIQVNQTFIDYRTGKLQPAIPQNFAEALQLAADQAKKIEEKNKLLVASNEGSIKAGEILIREFVKAYDFIRIGEKLMYRWLKKQKYIMQSKEPYQAYIARGYFTWKPSEEKHGGKYRYTLRITPRGRVWLAARYMQFLDSESAI